MAAETSDWIRPYELPRPKYALWYDVGYRLGCIVQALVFSALADSLHKMPPNNLLAGEIDLIKKLAKQRGVLIRF